MKIIPIPTSCNETGGIVALSGKAFVNSDEYRLHRAVARLKLIEKTTGVPLYVTVEEKSPEEGYTLTVDTDSVRIKGNSDKGAFWGLQTLSQMICEYGADSLPTCVIRDLPAFSERGFYHDVTRGKMPKLETLKQLVDKLALCKINSLQLYVEHAFAFKEYEGIVSHEEQLTADEIKELDEYCYERFIELVPCLATFGHLYFLLQSDRYKHLCELENYVPSIPWFIEWMIHHTIDVYNPESIKLISSLINQYAPLFRSKRFNICCDETFDLCNGRNKGKDKSEAYFYFLKLIIECVQKQGKQVMMWGDILLKNPELINKLPNDVIILNWEYTANPDENKVKAVADLGKKQILCPGTSAWDCIMPMLEVSQPNITAMAQYAKKYGAAGLLNTNWGDYGNIGSLLPALYPMAIGAAVSWNPDTTIDKAFKNSAALQLYGDRTGESIELLYRLSACESGNVWCNLCQWFAGWVELDFKAEDMTKRIAECEKIYHILEEMEALKTANSSFVENMKLNCRSVAMLCAIMRSAVSEDKTFSEEIKEWINDYTFAWLNENKESEVYKVTGFIEELILKVKRL